MSEHITHTASIKRLERSSSDRMVAGVAGGLGRYFDLNPGVFRLGFVVLVLLGGAGVLVYLAAVLVMPKEGEEQSIAARILEERRDRPVPLIALGLVGVAIAVLLSRGDLWPAAGTGWILILIIGLGVVFASRRERRSRVFLGIVIATLSLIAVALATAVVVAFAWFDVSLSDGVGQRTYTPANAAAVRSSYEIGIGDLKLDLTNVDRAVPTPVTAKVGIGDLRVTVPRDAAVTVNAHAKVGDVKVLGREDDGRNATVHVNRGKALVLDAHVGAGQIEVVRAQ
jgi:phage shock protein PspC (stress-responsive transcriptional regulator)/predicted membrane protein